MIYSEGLVENRPKINLNGPEGNVYCLFGYARSWAKQLGWDREKIESIVPELKALANYDKIVERLDELFGEYVDFYR